MSDADENILVDFEVLDDAETEIEDVEDVPVLDDPEPEEEETVSAPPPPVPPSGPGPVYRRLPNGQLTSE